MLVPTAERDPAVGLAMFTPVFTGVRALMFNSAEERAMIQGVAGAEIPGVIVGVGSEIPERTQPWRFRKKFNAKKPFAIYIGRIDENKGCKELFSHFERYSVMYPHGLISSWSGRRCCRFRSIRGSGTWGSCPTKTSSMRSRRPMC